MAVSDLSDSLKRSPPAGVEKNDSEQYKDALVVALTDSQSYIQNQAAECLARLLVLSGSQIVVNAVNEIGRQIREDEKEIHASALSVALRVVVTKIAQETEDMDLLVQLVPAIIVTLEEAKRMSSDIIVDLLATLTDVLEKAGPLLVSDKNDHADSIQRVLLDLTTDTHSTTVIRRAVTALGKFVVYVQGDTSGQALATIFTRYKKCASDDHNKNILLSALANIIRQLPSRVDDIVPTIIGRELEINNECTTEFRTTSLLALETAVRYCSAFAKDRRDNIFTVAVEALEYDPGYNYSMDEDDEDDDNQEGNGFNSNGNEDSDDEDFDDEYDEEVYEDSSDDTWNIRLAGVKLLAALVKSGLFDPEAIVNKIGVALVDRFKERVDLVRAEILATYAVTVETLKSVLMVASSNSSNNSTGMDVEHDALDALAQQAPSVVSAINSFIKEYPQSIESKQLSFVILTKLISTRASILDRLLSDIEPFVFSTLTSQDFAGALQSASINLVQANLKLDALVLLSEFVSLNDAMSKEADVFLFAIKDGLVANVSSKTFQVPAKSFDVVSSLSLLLRKSSAAGFQRYMAWLQEMAKEAIRFVGTAESKDSETRASAYHFIGTVLQQFGDIGDDALLVEPLLAILTSLNSTRFEDIVPQMNALDLATSTPTNLPKEKVVAVAPKIFEQISPLLQREDATTPALALKIIKDMASYGDSAVPKANVNDVLNGIMGVMQKSPISPPLVSLQALASICVYVSEDTMVGLFPDLQKLLITVPVYEHQTRMALEDIYGSLGKTFPALVPKGAENIMQSWTLAYACYRKELQMARDHSGSAGSGSKGDDLVRSSFPASTLSCLATSLLAMLIGYHQAQGKPWSYESIQRHIYSSPSSESDVALTCLALHVVGCAAEKTLLAQADNKLVKQLYEHISGESEDVRGEAAFALGSYVGKHMDIFNPLFEAATATSGHGGSVEASSKLQAIKAAVSMAIGEDHDLRIAEDLWSLITTYVCTSKSAVSEVNAQCLAVFATAVPNTYIPKLASLITSKENSNAARSLFITAFRTMLADRSLGPECDEQIKEVAPAVLASISDDDVDIRRLSMLVLFMLLQTKQTLLEDDTLADAQQQLFRQTHLNEQLVRSIKMGPFVKKVDDGLDARKTAYQCVLMLIRNLPQLADANAVVDSVLRGIADDQEIRFVVQQIVGESVQVMSEAYIQQLADIAEALVKVRGAKLPAKAVKQEVERHNDMLKSTIVITAGLMPLVSQQKSKDIEVAFDGLKDSMNRFENEELREYYISHF